MRPILPILLGAALTAAVQGATPAQAGQNPTQTTPVRIQAFILRVHVLDDSDALTWGDLTYRFRLQRGSAACAGYWCTGPADDLRLSVSMSATTTQVRGIYKMVGGDQGLALNPGDELRVGMAGVEEDWDGPGIAFCPIVPASDFDDSLCGAHDALGVEHNSFRGPTFGIGAHSQLVTKGGRSTFRVDYELRQVGVTTAAVSTPSASPEPSPRPAPRRDPNDPPRHEP
jgi:hypothetical protein